jgi:hypothetical protein
LQSGNHPHPNQGRKFSIAGRKSLGCISKVSPIRGAGKLLALNPRGDAVVTPIETLK